METARKKGFSRQLTEAEAERSGTPYAIENAWASTPVDDSGYQSIHLSQMGKERLKAKPERYKIGDVIGGRYAVLDIHRGSMGVIYATYDRVEKLPRALKTLFYTIIGSVNDAH